MSAMQRRKGASHEREVVNILKASGHPCARNLDQVRDGGSDIPFGDWLIECKRRATIAIYPWWDQVIQACNEIDYPFITKHKPLLVIRADKRENLVVMRLSDFITICGPAPACKSNQGQEK